MAVRNTNVNYDDPESVFKEIEIYIESLSSLKDKYNKEKSESNKSELDSFNTNENPLQFASSRLLADKDFAKRLVRTTTSGFKYLSNELKEVYQVIKFFNIHEQLKMLFKDKLETLSEKDKDEFFKSLNSQ